MIALVDLQRISELMPKLYTVISMADFPDQTLHLLARLIGLDPVVGLVNIATSLASSHLKPLKTFSLKQRKTIKRLPFLPYNLTRHLHTATKISDCSIESNSYRLLCGYWRCLQPIKPEDGLDEVISDPLDPTITHAIYLLQTDVICLSISRSQQTMSERDRSLLTLIRPHLIQAYHNAIAFTELQAQLDLQPKARSSELLSIESIRSIGLTKREAEVLWWAAQDKSNCEIAKLLECSLGTIKKHLEHIYDKLHVQSRTAAVMSALAKLGEKGEVISKK